LDQVFLNFLLNVRDAIEQVAGPSPQISIAAQEAEKEGLRYVAVCITDNGVGMYDDTRQRMFEPFFTTKEIGKGTGLGLATAYAVIQRHGGWIDTQSVVGTGTAITVYLPVAEDAIGSHASSPNLG
jgi:two-component system cell cycle sensor histidine kinase/response regulator CckA